MTEETTAVIEEYVECICRLEERSGVAKTSDIVKSLGVVPGTVTNTIERLEKDGLVTHVPYKGVKLTEKGRKIALQVIRKHRLSERLLVDILRMEWDKVHEVACKLEHSITEEVANLLEKVLKHPKTCPHGNPIPTKCGGIIKKKSKSLAELKVGEKSTITRITNESRDLLRYLGKLGLTPGASVEILEKTSLDGSITVKVDSAVHALSPAVASTIQVKTTRR